MASHTRVHTSLLAGIEKRALIWMAERLPARLNSDHLTALAAVAMAGVGLCYWAGTPVALLLVVVLLAVNWFGDSLDGTLARVRRHERPRYGFYVDHVLDVVGILFLFGGLVLGGFMSPWAGAGFLLAYYLLMIEIALATHAVGTFTISYWKFGPTELRILLAIGTLQLLRTPHVTILGEPYLLFDVGAAVSMVVLAATFVSAAVKHTRLLYRAEPVPSGRPRAASGDGRAVEYADDPCCRGRLPLPFQDPDGRETGGRRDHVREDARRDPGAGARTEAFARHL